MERPVEGLVGLSDGGQTFVQRYFLQLSNEPPNLFEQSGEVQVGEVNADRKQPH
jgi:hypothetical protein